MRTTSAKYKNFPSNSQLQKIIPTRKTTPASVIEQGVDTGCSILPVLFHQTLPDIDQHNRQDSLVHKFKVPPSSIRKGSGYFRKENRGLIGIIVMVRISYLVPMSWAEAVSRSALFNTIILMSPWRQIFPDFELANLR